MSQHALLSPSAAHRWIACPPSARLCENVADMGSTYAQAGTDAHNLAEFKLRKFLGEKPKDPRKYLTYYDQSMEEATDEYVSFCIGELERLKESGEPLMFIEQRVRYEEYVPQGSGSADCVIIGDGELVVIDYKNGALLVEAETNPQLRLYALGCLLAFDGIYDIDVVKMCIVQPNRENISVTTVHKQNLYQWAEEVVKPAAELAWEGAGEQHAGEHCQFCKIKAECRKRAEENMALAAYDFAESALLENHEISAILSQLDELTSWASDIKDYALTEALKGVKFDGFKVVEGRSNRRYIDENAVADTVGNAGYDPYEHSVLGLTAMEKMLGKKKFTELLEELIEKPAGKPTLVTSADKRQELNITTAAEDFADQ